MAKIRKVSSISKEFDGKEVQGKLIERSGLFGSKVSKEVFKMPSGGKHIEKTRTNKKGDVVSRMSRDTKVNPLKVFNDNKEKAYKKAGGEMSKYKKSLTKAQPGIQVGPQNNYWYNSTEKRAMSDAQDRYTASRQRSSNYDEDAQREYKALIDNYQPYGPIVPLADQVNELNKKYPYYDGIMETPFKGGDFNKGYDEMYKKADKKDSWTREKDLSDPYPNVGIGMINKRGGAIITKRKRK